MSDSIVCTYQRDGWRVIGRCEAFALATHPMPSRDAAEAEIVRLVTAHLKRDEFRCFDHKPTVDACEALR